MTQRSRRSFVAACLAVPAGLVLNWRAKAAAAPQGLGAFGDASPPPCKPDEKPTPAVAIGPEFKAGSPERSSLVEPGVTGTPLVVTGTVSGVTCGLIKHALVDFWQADATGAYDKTGFKLRGHQFTDANGAFKLQTIMPGSQRPRAPRLHVRVTPPGKAAFTTQLFFEGQPLNAGDPQFRKELAMKTADARGGKTATFNIVLDI